MTNPQRVTGQTDIERHLIQRFKKAYDEQDAADKALDKYFRPLVEDAIKRGDFALAKGIAKKCSSIGSICGCFFMDMIREAEKR